FHVQAGDGIRDRNVTGVQTCALPISLAIATVPTGAFLAGLIPWSRMSQPDLGLLLSILGTAAAQFALALVPPWGRSWRGRVGALDRKSTRLNSSHVSISYAVFCLNEQ